MRYQTSLNGGLVNTASSLCREYNENTELAFLVILNKAGYVNKLYDGVYEVKK